MLLQRKRLPQKTTGLSKSFTMRAEGGDADAHITVTVTFVVTEEEGEGIVEEEEVVDGAREGVPGEVGEHVILPTPPMVPLPEGLIDFQV